MSNIFKNITKSENLVTALTWQCHDKALAVQWYCIVLQPHSHDSAKAVKLQSQGSGIAMPLECHGSAIAVHGTAMARNIVLEVVFDKNDYLVGSTTAYMKIFKNI